MNPTCLFSFGIAEVFLNEPDGVIGALKHFANHKLGHFIMKQCSSIAVMKSWLHASNGLSRMQNLRHLVLASKTYCRHSSRFDADYGQILHPPYLQS